MPNEMVKIAVIRVSKKKKKKEASTFLELARYFTIMIYLPGSLILSLSYLSLNNSSVKNSQIKYPRFQMPGIFCPGEVSSFKISDVKSPQINLYVLFSNRQW